MSPLAEGGTTRFLKQRGFRVCQCEPYERTIYGKLEGPDLKDRFHKAFQSYSFRIFLRDVISWKEGITPERFGPFIDRERIGTYLEMSEHFGILSGMRDGSYSLALDDISDIGDTFECFLARTLRDMGYDVTWGIKFEGISSGGDYDVIGTAAGKLFYIEAKTSPPKHVELGEMRNFVERVISLMPDFAILLDDTHLRMKDKLVPLLEEELGGRSGKSVALERVEKEIFTHLGKLYITNSKRGIPLNIRICMENYFSREWREKGWILSEKPPD